MEDFSLDFSVDLDVQTKATVMAAALLINISYYEKSGVHMDYDAKLFGDGNENIIHRQYHHVGIAHKFSAHRETLLSKQKRHTDNNWTCYSCMNVESEDI